MQVKLLDGVFLIHPWFSHCGDVQVVQVLGGKERVHFHRPVKLKPAYDRAMGMARGVANDLVANQTEGYTEIKLPPSKPTPVPGGFGS